MLHLFKSLGISLSRGCSAKQASTFASAGADPLPSIDKGKKVVENLSSIPDNDVLNSVEVGANYTPASINELLCSKVFSSVLDVSDPHFFGVVYNLVCSTTQQSACSSRSLEALGDNLREFLLMVS